MRNLRTAILVGVMTVGGTTSAFAGAGEITTVVEALSPAVTYSSTDLTPAPVGALITHVGYKVTIKNAGGNTINNIRFRGITTVTDEQEKAVYSSAEGAICTPINPEKTEIECSIGQLTATKASTVVVFFRAPAKDLVTPIDNGEAGSCESTDCIKFSGQTLYAEGTGGANSIPQNSITYWPLAQSEPGSGIYVVKPLEVTLGTNNPTLVKSGVQKTGGVYFTGDGVPTGADKFATRVEVPASNGYTTVTINEAGNTDTPPPPGLTPCASTYFYTCYQSEITVPLPAGVSQFDYLTIILRQDKANITPGTKIGSIVIYYLADSTTSAVAIGDCASATTPNPSGPCIAKRTYYKNQSVPGYTVELDGDFEWKIISPKNGTYRFPT